MRAPTAKRAGSGSPPVIAAAIRSAIAGPCLKPWPEPPPSSHVRGVLGMAAGDEVRVRRELVAAARAAAQRRAGQRREAVLEVGAHARLGRARRRQLGVRVQRRPLLVQCHLDPERVDVARAVHRPVVVHPSRHAGRAPLRAAVEEEQLLARRGQRHETGEEPAEPAAAGPDHRVALETVGGDRTALKGLSIHDHRAALWSRPPSHDPRAVGPGGGGQRADRALRAQHARLGLEEHEAQVVAAEAREQPPGGGRIEPLARDALRGHGPLGGRLPAVLAVGEPGHAALLHQRLARLGLELPPQGAGAARARGVAGIRPVGGPDQPRLAARGRPWIAGLALVDQRDAVPGPCQPPRERRPEGAGADDDHVHRRDASVTPCSRSC